jgi:hypothetical protein
MYVTQEIVAHVRRLVGEYGFRNVYNTLQNVMKEEYEFLQTHFWEHKGAADGSYQHDYGENGVNGATAVVTPHSEHCNDGLFVDVELGNCDYNNILQTPFMDCTVPVYKENSNIMIPEIIPADPNPLTVKNVFVDVPVRKLPKKVTNESVLPVIQQHGVVDVCRTEVPNASVENGNVTIATPLTDKPASKFRDSKDMKVWQKEQEQKKSEELRIAGINPYTIMTVDNVRKWVEEDGMTYSAIAREYLGISDNLISAFAKKHNIQSKISKRRNKGTGGPGANEGIGGA